MQRPMVKIMTRSSFGSKATGLSRIPEQWTAPFLCFDPDDLSGSNDDFKEISRNIIQYFGNFPTIIRSSAAAETLADRGRFHSELLEIPSLESIANAIKGIYEQGLNDQVLMGVVAQAWKRPVMRGHFSNERRVSKTRNQWQVEVDYPRLLDFRINSQRDTSPQVDSIIKLRRKDIKRTLASVGNWAASTFESRVHMEWVYDNEAFWIVQLDLEDEAPDFGVDPRIHYSFSERTGGSEGCQSSLLQRWRPGTFSEFRKLEYLEEFSNLVGGSFPPIYVLRGQDAAAFLEQPNPEMTLLDMIGDRLVGRSDILPEVRQGSEGLNLPRTDTVKPDGIISFIKETLGVLSSKGISPDGVALIFHNFIPAVSAAWAEADPNEAIVQVDALWGLPDGLQYLDHDLFEYDVATDSISAEHIPYKSAFLHEATDGTWSVKPVGRTLGRTASISRDDVAKIAKSTHHLSQKVGSRLRVMWFVGVYGRPHIAHSVPWFCHCPHNVENIDAQIQKKVGADEDRSHLKRLPLVEIQRPEDIKAELSTPHRLRLMPATDHMRNNKFLEDVAAYAKDGRHAIELRGSGLAHAYYLLSKENVPIIVPSQRNHLRVRRLQTFGKLVRDGIPKKIRENHEEVGIIKVPAEDRRRLLISKLMEEAQEVIESTNRDDLRSELADVLEVVKSLAREANFDMADIENTASLKAAKLGSFNEGIVLVDTSGVGLKAARRRRRNQLAVVPTREGNTVTIPHMALVGDSVELPLGGQDIRVSLTTDGLVLEELGPRTDDGQLRLDLDIST